MGFFTRKSIKELGEHTLHDEYELHRSLGSWDLILFGIGAIIGAGLFSITGIAAAENAGPAIALSFIVAAIGCAFAGLCYSELVGMIPLSGSAYTYAYATMGELVAWIIGWDLILEYAIGAATVSISWSAYIIALLQDYDIHLPVQLIASPWQPVQMPDGSRVYGWINLPAFFIVSLISILLMTGIKQSSRVNALIVTIKVAVVLLFIALGIIYIKPDNYHPFIPENTGEFGEFGFSGIMKAAGVVFFAYIGFDAVSTTAQEAKNPQKSVPIGILGSLGICTFLYVIFAIVLTGLVHYDQLNVAAPVALAINQTPFTWINSLIKLAIIAGLTSVILVMLLGQSRIFYSMSLDGLLPPILSKVHSAWRTPWYSHIILMFFVGAFGAFAPISLVGHMTSIGTLLAFIIVCVGVIILRYTEPNLKRHFRVPFSPTVPLLGCGVCLAMMVSLGADNWIRLLVWLGIGMIIYFSYGYRKGIVGK